MFSEALVYLSLDGDRFQATPVRFHPVVERPRQFTLNVTIPLHNRVGRFLKLQMRFASRWILLSEVSFDSGELLSDVSDIVMSKVSENLVEWKVADSIKLMAHCTADALLHSFIVSIRITALETPLKCATLNVNSGILSL